MEETTKEVNVADELKKELFYKSESAYACMDAAEREKAYDYCKGYMSYMDNGKTERECVKYTVAMLTEAGFKPYNFGDALNPGDKYYYNNRGKSLAAFIVGKKTAEEGVFISVAHIDSPRMDLKQHPLYEADGMGFFKTHYYGGIKKYQWTTIPLALHGTIVRKDGTSVDIMIGDEESDPIFYVNDLLPHLAGDQMRKSLSEGISGEQLNILIGSEPYDSKVSEGIKLNIMKILNEKYGITENDFISAEISAVPAAKAREIGFDRSLIGAYGHDDKVCAYPSVTALLECGEPEHTVMAILADKEEIGSECNSGMKSWVYRDIIETIATTQGVSPAVCRANSKCLSADVNAVFDPNFPEVCERRNSCFINHGTVVTKFTGSRGKSGSNDASAEFVGYVRNIFDEAGVVWQTAELGKVDCGGGGTVAKFVAEMNIDVVDLGVPVISMHAPYEVIAKTDLYMTHKGITAFFKK